MKTYNKFFALLACAALAAGCSKEEIGAELPAPDLSSPISLSAGICGAEGTADDATRASIDTEKFPAMSPAFRVVAYNGTSTPTSWSSPYMPSTAVNSDASGALSWADGNTHYWPVSGNLYFYAWSPDTATFSAGSGSTAPTVSYVLNGSQDVMYATAISARTDAAVPLTFSHKLMKVTFKAVTTEYFPYDRTLTNLKVLDRFTNVKLDLKTGALITSNNSKADINVYDSSTGITLTTSAKTIGSILVVPSTDLKFVFTAFGKTYNESITLDSAKAVAGSNVEVTVTFNETNIGINLGFADPENNSAYNHVL